MTCQEHQCKPQTECTDDAFCNVGLSNVCDIENFPYTTCFYCLSGECLPGKIENISKPFTNLLPPGCVTDSNCPAGYTCQGDHLCQAPAGRVLIESITVSTKTGCTDCSKEGVTLTLLGEKNGNFEHGVPCSTRTLDHASTIDYDGSNGSKARFDGTLNGATDDQEKGMMGGCYGVSLMLLFIK